MIQAVILILIGAVIENLYPFVGKTVKWAKEKLNKIN